MLIQPTTFMHTTPSLTELLKLAIVPVPSAPFGVGAEWHVTDNDSRRTYTVTAITPTTLSLRFAASYDGQSTSSGTFEVDIDDMLARSFEITQVTHLSAGSAQVDMTSNITLKSLP